MIQAHETTSRLRKKYHNSKLQEAYMWLSDEINAIKELTCDCCRDAEHDVLRGHAYKLAISGKKEHRMSHEYT